MRPDKQNQYIRRIVGVFLCLSVTLYAFLSNYVICFDPSSQHSEIELARHPSSQHHVSSPQPAADQLEPKLTDINLARGCIDMMFQNIVSFSSKLEVKQDASQLLLPTLFRLKNAYHIRHHARRTKVIDRRLAHVYYAYRELKNLRTINIRR